MPYVEGSVVHDADSHIMEAPNFLDGYVEERYAESIRRKHMFSVLGEKSGKDLFAVVRGRHDDPKWRAEAADQILLRKNYEALGSWRREDMPRRSTLSASRVSACSPPCSSACSTWNTKAIRLCARR
jgi:uncharacterized protein